MKTTESISESLGFTQHEMAAVLKISRSQWSLFELGKRSLPSHAALLLAALLHHTKTPEMQTKIANHATQQQTNEQQQYESMLRENHYQQLVVAKSLKTLSKKYESQLKAFHHVAFLSDHATQKGKTEKDYLEFLARKAAKAIGTKESSVLFTHQHKQEVLLLEQALLESKLKKLNGRKMAI